MKNPTIRMSVVLRTFVALASLATAGVTHAQNATVTAANASNDAIYDVTFSKGGGSITVLNTDKGSLHSIVSLVFVPNTSTFALDLLAADNAGGLIVRYPGDFHPGDPTTGTVIFSGGPPGPANPDGLSVDSAGDLYVVNSGSGHSSNPQLWVLPSDNNGGFLSPVLIDSNYASKETLADTLVASTTVVPPGGNQPVVFPGDVLVATSNPSQVLRYAAANGVSPITATTPTVLVTLPAGSIPGGLAFWPADNSLLVSTVGGTIYQYHLTPNETPAKFASGLGNGQFKVRTGVQSGIPYAYVAQNNGGDILQFAGPNQLVATVTSGVQHPQGLAVTNTAYAPLNTCQQTGGCDLFGGKVITYNVPPFIPVAGNVVEQICLVAVDPRLAQGGSCSSALHVSQICGGFSDTITIPASLCGASGPTGKGFALIKVHTQAEASPNSFPFNGVLIGSDSNLPNVLPGPTDPVCNPSPGVPALGALVWAPLAGEGVVAEGTDMVELTSTCDGSGGRYASLSLFAEGLAVNTTSLTGYTASKYTNLLTTIQGESSPAEGALPAAVPPSVQPPDGNFTSQLEQCVSTSQAVFARGNSGFYAGAANEVLAADQQVANALELPLPPANPSNPFTADADYPNPSGALRSRLENIYYTINTRISGNQAGAAPPLSPPPPPPPSITGKPATTAKAGAFYSFTPGATDFTGYNDGTLTFSIVGLPSWAMFNTASGVLSGTAVQGTYSGIVITVTDGCASASLPAFSITVSVNTKKGGGDGDDH